MPRLVDVALPLPLADPFTYHVPPGLEEAAEPGMRATVEFRRDLLTGVIVAAYAEGERSLGFTTKPIQDLPDPEPVFDAAMLRLTRWVADYYLASWGEALRTALPQGVEQKSRWIVRTTGADPNGVAAGLAGRAPSQAKLLRLIADRGEMSLAQLRTYYGGRGFRSALRALEAADHLTVDDEAPAPLARIKTELTVRRMPVDPSSLEIRLTHKQSLLLDRLGKTADPVSLSVVRNSWGISRDTVTRMARRGLVALDKCEVLREPDLGPSEPETAFELTADQAIALEVIRARLKSDAYAAVLCHGVTGSGKTRLYMDAIQHVLERGGGAIALVPEISLTPQTVRRFKSRFGDEVAVLHSRLSVGERYDAWRQVRGGRKRLAVGPRSAVFAPVQNLRLIVVDEEHDTSYKQSEHAPRYQARDVAVVRAQQAKAVVVLGSATPSLESFHNVGLGKYVSTTLPARIDGRPLPPVTIVEMAKERSGGNFSSLSRPLRQGIRERAERGEQVVILQNRRGFAPIVQCGTCGHVFECTDCQVSLTHHQADDLLKCHYCGGIHPVPRLCPVAECGSDDLQFGGIGTQKVQEQLAEAFPDAAMIRMDQDTTRRKNAHHRLLEQFRHQEASILLGTQMVAKGLDFPNVTLVGVIEADVGLGLPDFRASERSFQLLTQVAGRTGRSEKGGEVLIQTYQPDHPAVLFASRHDVAGFAKWELALRRQLGYPPFGRLVLLLVRGTNPEKTAAAAATLGRIAEQEAPGEIEVLGPVEAPIPRIKKYWRWHILLKGTNSRALHALAAELRSRHEVLTKSRRSVQLTIDVDPMTIV